MSKYLEMPAITSKFAVGETVFVKEGSAVAARQISGIKCIIVVRDGDPLIKTEITYQLYGGYTYEEDRIYKDPYAALGVPNPFIKAGPSDETQSNTKPTMPASEYQVNDKVECRISKQQGIVAMVHPDSNLLDVDWERHSGHTRKGRHMVNAKHVSFVS